MSYSRNDKRAAKILKNRHSVKHMRALCFIDEAKRDPSYGDRLAEGREQGLKVPERIAYAVECIIGGRLT